METHREFQGERDLGYKTSKLSLLQWSLELVGEVSEGWLRPSLLGTSLFSKPTQQDGGCPVLRMELSAEPLTQKRQTQAFGLRLSILNLESRRHCPEHISCLTTPDILKKGFLACLARLQQSQTCPTN